MEVGKRVRTRTQILYFRLPKHDEINEGWSTQTTVTRYANINKWMMSLWHRSLTTSHDKVTELMSMPPTFYFQLALYKLPD